MMAYSNKGTSVDYLALALGGPEFEYENKTIETVIGGLRSKFLTGLVLHAARVLYASSFSNCINLKYCILPAISGSASGGSVFRSCNSLEKADLGESYDLMASGMFEYALPLHTIVLRRASAPCKLKSQIALSGTPFKPSGSYGEAGGGTVYIPEVLYNHLGDGTTLDYLSDSNWSTLNASGLLSWAKIEGSQYETHYVNGQLIS